MTNWDNQEYAEIELHSSEVLCSLETVLASLKAPLPYFPSSVFLLAQVIWRVLPDLSQGQEPSALFRAPGWIHGMSRALGYESLLLSPPSPLLDPGILYPFTQSLSSVSATCFSGWVTGDVLHAGVKTPLGEICKRCRRTERVSLFLVSYISPWFSRAEPGTCCRESMSGLSMLQCRISGWGNPCRIVLVHSGNMRPECMRHCGNPLKAVSCFPSRPNLPFSGLISTIPSLYLEQSIYLLYFGQFRLFCCDRNLMGIKHSWWVSSPHRSQVLVPWDTLSP